MELSKGRRLPGAVKLPVALLLLALLALAVSRFEGDPAPPERRPTSGAPATWADAVTRLGSVIAADRARARAARPDEWLVQEVLANRLMARARLTGSFDDLAEAQSALDRGFAGAAPGTGPHMTQASLALATHRLPLLETMLDAVGRYAVPVDAEDRDEATGLRGDLAFYRGRYREAQLRYADSRSRYRQALLAMRTGRPDTALALIDADERASRWPTAQTLANLALLRGAIALQRGQRDEATRQFDRAATLFPGFWLADAHRAQMLALAGRREEALRLAQAVVARRPDPLVMDLIAGIHRAGGDAAASRAWAALAAAGWAQRLRQLPEAARGHAVEHELAFGDARRALSLALADYRARPHGATAVALGWALLANDRPAAALRLMAAVNRSSWVSAEQHLVAARALLLLGRGAEAAAEQDRALALNPHAADADAALIWFGH